MVWNGYLNIPRSGGYQFWTESDDGSTLSIDNDMVVNNDGDHGMEEKTGFANLQQGWHRIKVVYFNSGGGSGLKVWNGAGRQGKGSHTGGCALALGHLLQQPFLFRQDRFRFNLTL